MLAWLVVAVCAGGAFVSELKITVLLHSVDILVVSNSSMHVQRMMSFFHSWFSTRLSVNENHANVVVRFTEPLIDTSTPISRLQLWLDQGGRLLFCDPDLTRVVLWVPLSHRNLHLAVTARPVHGCTGEPCDDALPVLSPGWRLTAWHSGNDMGRVYTSGPVSTGMGDHLWAGKPPRYATSHPGQLSLLLYVGWEMSTVRWCSVAGE